MNNAENNTIRKEFGPSSTRLALHVTIASIIILIALLLLSNEQTNSNQAWGYGLLAIGILILAARINDALKNQPKIILTPRGIEYCATRRSQFHAWPDIGTFTVKTQRVRYNSFRYICAYTDINHDALHKDRDSVMVNLYNADVTLQITDMKMGRSEELAETLVEEINEWRNTYGAPENNAYHLTNHQVEKLRRKKVWRTRLSILGLMLLPITIHIVVNYMN